MGAPLAVDWSRSARFRLFMQSLTISQQTAQGIPRGGHNGHPLARGGPDWPHPYKSPVGLGGPWKRMEA